MTNTKQTKEINVALQKYFGFSTFRSSQKEVVLDVINRKDCLVVMPTGAGKSLCYQLPALVMEGMAVIISPLISLMKDQVDAMQQSGIEADFINSTQDVAKKQSVIKKALSGELQMLYVSPETFSNSTIQELLGKVELSLIAVDEAHCISMWGHDFRPEYRDLGRLAKGFDVPIIALTATADKVTRKDITERLQLATPQEYVLSFLRENLSIEVRAGRDRFENILNFLDDKKDDSGIIYCLSRKGTENLAEKLKQRGKNAAHYHAGMPTEKREKIQESFSRDNTQIICATVAFGMGIDKSNVRWVIHYNMPQSMESYYQEIGRAGRDGLPAQTLLFSSLADVMTLKKIIGPDSTNKVKISKLNRMFDYSESFTCRWNEVLSYFGEEAQETCKTCDICKNPPKKFNGKVIVQKALSAIKRAERPIQRTILSQILRGSKTKIILQFGYDKIKTFGKGGEFTNDEWYWYIDQMISQGLVDMCYDHYNTLKITESGNDVLYQDNPVALVEFNTTNTRSTGATPTVTPLNEVLFTKLKTLRKSIADEANVPAFIIFTDKSLHDMAQKFPVTHEAFLKIDGVGESKLKKYAEKFIEEITNFLEQEHSSGKKIKGGTHLATMKLFKSGMSPEEIATERELKVETIYNHLIKLIQLGFKIDMSPYIKQSEIDLIKKAIGEVKEPGLGAVHKALERNVEYWKIRYVMEL